MAEKPPIRITKQRAQAFLDAADRGIDEHIDDLKEAHGVRFTRDGKIEYPDRDGEFTLITEEDQADIEERVEQIVRAIDTLAIFRRRYG